jgi:hypothetical protein
MYPEPYNGPERRQGDRRHGDRRTSLTGLAAPFARRGTPERRQQGRRATDRTMATPREQLLDIARTFLEEEAS